MKHFNTFVTLQPPLTFNIYGKKKHCSFSLNVFFCVLQKKESHTGFEQHEMILIMTEL